MEKPEWKFENNRVSWDWDWQYTSCLLTDDQLEFAKRATKGKVFMDFLWCSYDQKNSPDGGLLNMYFKEFGPDREELMLRSKLIRDTNEREQNFIWEIRPPQLVDREASRKRRERS